MELLKGPRGGIYYWKNGYKVYINVSFGKKQKKKTAIRTNESLWKSIVEKVKKGNKGGKSGQWSARKAQLAVKIYKEKGGSYRGTTKGNSLKKWTKQNWRTKSGKPSIMGKNATGERYLPERVIKKLSTKEYNSTTASKRRSIAKGKQYSKQPKKISKKVWKK